LLDHPWRFDLGARINTWRIGWLDSDGNPVAGIELPSIAIILQIVAHFGINIDTFSVFITDIACIRDTPVRIGIHLDHHE
jgi:hypothetical protein